MDSYGRSCAVLFAGPLAGALLAFGIGHFFFSTEVEGALQFELICYGVAGGIVGLAVSICFLALSGRSQSPSRSDLSDDEDRLGIERGESYDTGRQGSWAQGFILLGVVIFIIRILMIMARLANQQ